MPKTKLNDLKDYYEKFEKMQGWMINDLRNTSIKAHANLLVGMGIFNYIEILGSFYYYDNKKTTNRDKFDLVFSQLMGVQYESIYRKLNELTKRGAYDILRCGLTHEYLIKNYQMNAGISMDFTIYGVDDGVQYDQNVISNNCGIELITLDQKYYHLRVYNPRLIYDLNLAFETYKRRIRSNARGVGDTYRERFVKRCENINFKRFT